MNAARSPKYNPSTAAEVKPQNHNCVSWPPLYNSGLFLTNKQPFWLKQNVEEQYTILTCTIDTEHLREDSHTSFYCRRQTETNSSRATKLPDLMKEMTPDLIRTSPKPGQSQKTICLLNLYLRHFLIEMQVCKMDMWKKLSKNVKARFHPSGIDWNMKRQTTKAKHYECFFFFLE